MTLRLVSLSFHAVELVADFGDGVDRLVRVEVGTGRDWYRAVHFPGFRDEASESLGDEGLDRQVRERAAEELIRLEAAAAIAGRRWAA